MCKRYHPSVTYPTKNQSETTDVRATTRRDADIDIEGASAPAILVVDLDMLMVNLWVKPLLPLVVKPYYSARAPLRIVGLFQGSSRTPAI